MTTGNLNIMTASQTTGNVNVLSRVGTGKMIVNGSGIASAAYDTINSSTGLSLAGSLTTANISIGDAMTTGNMNIMTGTQTTGNISVFNTNTSCKMFVRGQGICSDRFDSLATNSPAFSIAPSMTGGNILFATNSLSTKIYIGNWASSYTNGNFLIMQTFQRIQQSISSLYNRSYHQVFGKIDATQTNTDQTCYTFKNGINGASNCFQLDLNTNSAGNFAQSFELNIGGTNTSTFGVAGRYNFYILQNASTVPATISSVTALGPTIGTSSEDLKFNTSTVRRVTLSFTPQAGGGPITANVTLRSFITINSQWGITPL